MPRQAQQFVGGRHQHVVDSPGVDAHTPDPIAETVGRRGQAVLDAPPQTQHVPSQRVANPDRAVGEPVQLFETDRTAVEEPCDHAATLGSQIHTQITLLGHGAHDSGSPRRKKKNYRTVTVVPLPWICSANRRGIR